MNRLPADTAVTYDLEAVPVRRYYQDRSHDTMLALWRHRGLIAVILLASLAIAGSALMILPKKYTAEAIIQLDLGRPELPLANEQAPPVTLDASSIIQGEAKIIQSRMMARRVLEKLGDNADAPVDSWQSIDGAFAA